MTKTFGKKKPMWAAVLLLIAMASLAAGALSPQLTKNGAISAGVGERVIITGASISLTGGGVTATTLVTPATNGEEVEGSFIIYVGGSAELTVNVGSLSSQTALVSFTCSAPSGLAYFPAASSTTFRTGVNEQKALVSSGSGATFTGDFKGLQEGDYSISCIVQDLGGQ